MVMPGAGLSPAWMPAPSPHGWVHGVSRTGHGRSAAPRTKAGLGATEGHELSPPLTQASGSRVGDTVRHVACGDVVAGRGDVVLGVVEEDVRAERMQER